MIRKRWTLAGVLGLGLFPLPWDLFPLVIPAAQAQAQSATPRTFAPTTAIRLPIQIDDKTRGVLRELKLYVKAPGADWVCCQTATPAQTAFDYKAEKEGEHAFMFVLVAKDGRTSPASLDSRPPHQIIVVDTTKPVLNVQPLPYANREIFLQCQMLDANPDLASVKLEYDAGDNQWKPMDLAKPDSPAVFRIPFAGVLEGKVRATARDKAGNVAQRVIDLGDPTRSMTAVPKANEPVALPNDLAKPDPRPNVPPVNVSDPGTVQSGYRSAPATNDALDLKIPDVDPRTPANGPNLSRTLTDKPKEPVDPLAIPDLNAPPIVDPKTTGGNDLVLPNDLKKDAKVDPFLPQIDPVKPVTTPQDTIKPAPTAKDVTIPDVRPVREKTTELRQGGPQGGHPIINTPHCTVEYAVENVVVGGQPKMEFWSTKDNGRTWARVPDESGGRSPAKLLLPGDGVYGIRIKANGNGQQPHLGEAPDCWVEVDAIPPTVRLLQPAVGTGADVGTMTIQWLATDKNLVSDSISLKYADRPDGPWLPIATNLRNEGTYRWLIPAGVGAEVYLRLEAHDRAGNLGRNELRDPVVMPQPKVKVLGVGPAR